MILDHVSSSGLSSWAVEFETGEVTVSRPNCISGASHLGPVPAMNSTQVPPWEQSTVETLAMCLWGSSNNGSENGLIIGE